MATCGSCGAENGPEANFCQRCGVSLARACPRCGTDFAPGARFCGACGQPLAEGAPDERKVATIVFIDLVGSTELADGADPETTRSILQAYFGAVSAIVGSWGGTVEKFIGDAVVAVFGVPRVREDDPIRALGAALEIVERMPGLAAELGGRLSGDLVVRIGIETGEVISPTEVRQDRAMVTGDTVNLAARLQSAAEPGTILVGEHASRLAADAYRFGDPVSVNLKGIARPVTARTLVGSIAAVSPERTARGLRSRMVGRDRELASLMGLLEDVIESGRPRFGLVVGPAGIGKSRLLQEFTAIVSGERPDLRTLRGRCPAVGQGIAYWALAEIVRGACGIAIDDAPAEAEAKLDRRVGATLAAAGAAAADTSGIVQALATTTGLAMSDNPLDRAPPLTIRKELTRAWPLFVSALAAQRPLVLVVEDLHWASPQLVEMLDLIVGRSVGPILVLGTARPEFAESHPTLVTGRDDVTLVSLRPLGTSASKSLVAGLLASGLPGELEGGILETAEGNPLFIEEIVARLIEQGALVRDGLAWRATAAARVDALPDTITGILAARIDALGGDAKRTLQEASVIGRTFWEAPLAEVLDAAAVSIALADLERRGLVSMRPTSSLAGQAEYAFKHALVRDVAYSGLPKSRRAVAHAAIADWLAARGSGNREELAELVAAHYLRAIDEADAAPSVDPATLEHIHSGAFEALLAGGASARKRFAIDRAIELHGRALAIAPTPEARARVLEEIGDDHDAAYHGDQAVPVWDEALTIIGATGGHEADIARLSMKAAHMGAVRWGGFAVPMDPERIDRYVDAGLAAVTDEDTRARLLALRCAAGVRWTAFHRVDPVALTERIAAGEAAYDSGMRLEHYELAGLALYNLGGLYLTAESVERCLWAQLRILEIADRIETSRDRHLYSLGAYNTLIWVAGQASTFVERLDRFHQLGRELSAHELLHSTYIVLSALYLLGRWDEAKPIIDEHVATFALEEDMVCPYVRGGLGVAAIILARQGDVVRSRAVLAMIPQTEAPVGLVEGLQAMTALALDDPASARDGAERLFASGERAWDEEAAVEIVAYADAVVALGAWDELATRLPELRARTNLLALAPAALDRAEGLAAAAAGDDTRSMDLLRRSVEAFDGSSPYDAARSREALAQVDPQAAGTLLEAALATYERLGAVADSARVRVAVEAAASSTIGR